MLIFYKTFENIDPPSTGGLKKPSNWQINICHISSKIFEKHFQTICSQIGIVSTMTKLIMAKLDKNTIKMKNDQCQQHLVYMINLLLTIRVFKECKWQKNHLQYSTKRIPKLRIFEHQ
jgi:hypothetical protein